MPREKRKLSKEEKKKAGRNTGRRKKEMTRSFDAIGVGEVVDLLLEEFKTGEEDGVGEGGAEDGDGEPCGFLR